MSEARSASTCQLMRLVAVKLCLGRHLEKREHGREDYEELPKVATRYNSYSSSLTKGKYPQEKKKKITKHENLEVVLD